MNARLLPLLSSRTEYVGYACVSRDDFSGWVSMNTDVLAANYFAQGGLGLDGLAAFSAREWEKQREARDDYRRTAESFDGAF